MIAWFAIEYCMYRNRMVGIYNVICIRGVLFVSLQLDNTMCVFHCLYIALHQGAMFFLATSRQGKVPYQV